VIGTGPPRDRIHVTFRYDVPDPPDQQAARRIAAHAADVLDRTAITRVIVVGYGPGPLVTPLADALRAMTGRYRLRLHDVLRVHDGRYWSYLCAEPSCCPAEGVPYDTADDPVALALAAAGGSAVLADRAALAASLAPADRQIGEFMRRAADRAERRAADITRRGAQSGGSGASASRPTR
jgi:hypothetical protein